MKTITVGWWYITIGKQDTMGNVYNESLDKKKIMVGNKRLEIDDPTIKYHCPAPTREQALALCGEMPVDNFSENGDKDVNNSDSE